MMRTDTCECAALSVVTHRVAIDRLPEYRYGYDGDGGLDAGLSAMLAEFISE